MRSPAWVRMIDRGSSDESGEVEVQRVKQLDSRVRRVHLDVVRHVEQSLRVVEDDLDARIDQLVSCVLRAVGRYRNYADDDVLVADHAPEARGVKHGPASDR